MAEEKFKRRARWEYVPLLRKALDIPVAGNGDIASAEELAAKAGEGPAMAGRLAVRRPWVFAQARRGEMKNRRSEDGGERARNRGEEPGAGKFGGGEALEETALRFLDLLARYQPPEFHMSRARRFFRYYCDNFTWAEYLRNLINREETLGGIAGLIREYCRDHEKQERGAAAAESYPIRSTPP
jgi:tRNA-dihydrouridine synthase